MGSFHDLQNEKSPLFFTSSLQKRAKQGHNPPADSLLQIQPTSVLKQSSIFFSCMPTIYLNRLQVNPYFLIIEKKNMEVQSMSAPLFVPLSEVTAHTLRNQPITFQALCSLQAQAWTNHSLKLINHILLLEQADAHPLFLEITFDAKFEILYQTQKNVHSPKLGIRFYDEDERGLRVFMESAIVQQWLSILRKKMNQKGFHQMFKPTRKLGKGNFATVYEAQRLTDRERFAVKAFIKQNCFSSKNGKQSLINELNILRQLNQQPHTNILKLEGVYESDNSIYVVLELLTGKTLYHAIEDRNGRFSKKEIRDIVGGLFRGLRYMHGRRIMHRDLKPENIMLRGDSLQPVIVDFGLATFADLNEYLFFRCGTPGYVAPQILRLTQFQHIDPICDVFSLGAVFHLLLCRKSLFAGSKYEQVCQNNKQCNIKLDGDYFSGVSNSSRELLQRMLALDPKGRITPAQALNHHYFSEQDTDESCDLKISSPVLTDISNYKEPQIKRMGLLFY